jgi:hypothetical protein
MPSPTRSGYLRGRGWTDDQIAADRGHWTPDWREIFTSAGQRTMANYLHTRHTTPADE